METFMRTSVCLILCVAASLCKAHALYGLDQEKEPSACDRYCEISIQTNNGLVMEILPQGGSTKHPENQCTTYFCQAPADGVGPSIITQVETTQCEEILVCPDGRPSYSMDGECCPGCHPPVDGGWSDWTQWTSCSASCEGGIHERGRGCTNPSPQFGGKDCIGSNYEIDLCNEHPCPIHGRWTPWSQWTACSASCGPGNRSRSRECNDPPPQYGGNHCAGGDHEESTCNLQPCPVHGRWTSWSQWTACSASCGSGSRSRSRECNDPPPQYGGNHCTGSDHEVSICNSHPCPVDGGWSDWTQWGSCSASCDGGIQERSRECNNPSPKNGGKDCKGDNSETESCNEHDCPMENPPVDGGWSDWTQWTSCSASCDGGTRERRRECNNPPPQFGGRDCTGFRTEIGSCNEHNCDPCDLNPCFQGRKCTALSETEAECEPCPDGYVGDGKNCEPDTECDEKPCFPGVNCNELDNGFECDPCPVGYTGNQPRGKNREEARSMKQTCTDIDECEDEDACGGFRKCKNTEGSYVCECPVGYIDVEGSCLSCFDTTEWSDMDRDGIHDACDNCPEQENRSQRDEDGDGKGDVCDDDDDGDNLKDEDDPCPRLWQVNNLENINDADHDNVDDECDNCPGYEKNAEQCDIDQDGIGDCCQPFPFYATDDDRILVRDNCDEKTNHDQADRDGDGRGDACDTDIDGDGVIDEDDRCKFVKGDKCDGDRDGDGVGDETDVCPSKYLVQTTNFNKTFEVPVGKDPPRDFSVLRYGQNGNLIHLKESEHYPHFLMSFDILESMKFSGNVSFGSPPGSGVFGMVFNYVTNRRFNILKWSSEGLELWLVNITNRIPGSIQAKGTTASYSVEHISHCLKTKTCDVSQFKQAPPCDLDLNGYDWTARAVHHWEILYSAEKNCISVKVYNEDRLQIGQCTASCADNKGGRVGLYADEIEDIVWYDLKYECLEEGDPQLDCEGPSSCGRDYLRRFFLEKKDCHGC